MAIDNHSSTVVTKQRHAVVEPYLVEYRGGKDPSRWQHRSKSVDDPLAEGFLIKYYGAEEGVESVEQPLSTVTTKERFGLVQPVIRIDGQDYLLDIRFRMLQPHELSAAQGFPKTYKFTGKKTEVVKQIGNAVPCGLARALVRAALSQENNVS